VTVATEKAVACIHSYIAASRLPRRSQAVASFGLWAGARRFRLIPRSPRRRVLLARH